MTLAKTFYRSKKDLQKNSNYYKLLLANDAITVFSSIARNLGAGNLERTLSYVKSFYAMEEISELFESKIRALYDTINYTGGIGHINNHVDSKRNNLVEMDARISRTKKIIEADGIEEMGKNILANALPINHTAQYNSGSDYPLPLPEGNFYTYFPIPNYGYREKATTDYKYFFIPKKDKGKLRVITSPKKNLKDSQKILSRDFIKYMDNNDNILAYKPGKDYIDLLENSDMNYSYMLNIDIKNYFHQINNSKLEIALGGLLNNMINKDICKLSDIPENINKSILKVVNEFYNYIESIEVDDSLPAVKAIKLENLIRLASIKLIVTVYQKYPKILEDHLHGTYTNLSSFNKRCSYKIMIAGVQLSLLKIFDAVGPDLYFKRVSHKMSPLGGTGRVLIKHMLETNFGKNTGFETCHTEYSTSTIHILLKKLIAMLVSKIPINYEDEIASKNISLEDLKGMLYDHDLEKLSKKPIELKPKDTLSNYIKETGFSPQFKEFVATYGDSIKWIEGLPQGAPTSGTIVNFLNSHIYNNLTRELDRLLFLKNYKILIYSDNIYILYNLSCDANPYLPASKIFKIVNGRLEKIGLMPNKDKEMFFNKSDKKMLGILVDKDGKLRTSRSRLREINQIIINLNKKETINYKGRVYTRKDCQRLKGLINWLTRPSNEGYMRRIKEIEF